MKVVKAIEILELNIPKEASKMPPDIKDALKLGVEALKRHRDRDYLNLIELNTRLPGETPAETPDAEPKQPGDNRHPKAGRP